MQGIADNFFIIYTASKKYLRIVEQNYIVKFYQLFTSSFEYIFNTIIFVNTLLLKLLSNLSFIFAVNKVVYLVCFLVIHEFSLVHIHSTRNSFYEVCFHLFKDFIGMFFKYIGSDFLPRWSRGK